MYIFSIMDTVGPHRRDSKPVFWRRSGNVSPAGRRGNRQVCIYAKYAKGEESMRKYVDGGDKQLMEVVCNKCGRSLKVENGYLREYCFSADTVFGYFSRKDGTVHHFDLCEECYDDMTAQFAVPVEETENPELL